MKNIREQGTGVFLCMVSAVFALISLIGFCIYGVVYDYFDTAVCAGLVLAIVFAAAYIYLNNGIGDYMNLLASICLSFSVALFGLNSFPVWADNLNGITMYGSRGGLAPVIILMVIMFVGIVCTWISCFMGREGGARNEK